MSEPTPTRPACPLAHARPSVLLSPRAWNQHPLGTLQQAGAEGQAGRAPSKPLPTQSQGGQIPGTSFRCDCRGSFQS